jgi:hypothetical protein
MLILAWHESRSCDHNHPARGTKLSCQAETVFPNVRFCEVKSRSRRLLRLARLGPGSEGARYVRPLRADRADTMRGPTAGAERERGRIPGAGMTRLTRPARQAGWARTEDALASIHAGQAAGWDTVGLIGTVGLNDAVGLSGTRSNLAARRRHTRAGLCRPAGHWPTVSRQCRASRSD